MKMGLGGPRDGQGEVSVQRKVKGCRKLWSFRVQMTYTQRGSRHGPFLLELISLRPRPHQQMESRCQKSATCFNLQVLK